MKTSIKESKILKEVVNEFLKKRDEIGEEEILVILRELNGIKNRNFIRNVSSYILTFSAKIVNIPFIEKTGDLIKNLITYVFLNYFEMDREYLKKILDYFSRSSLNFCYFVDKYGIKEKEYKCEYLIACFLTVLVLPIGKIEDFKLWESITKLWVLMDNMCDRREYMNWVKESTIFFEERIWLDENKRKDFLKKKGNPIIEILNEIELNKNNMKIYNRFYKLFLFSYKRDGYNKERNELDEKRMLKYSCLKARKSLDIFQYSMDFERDEVNLKEYYARCLGIQLLDDLMDIKKDKEENGNTIFTKGNKKNNDRSAICVIKYLNEYNNKISEYLITLTVLFIHYNKEYFTDEFVEKIINNTEIIDLDNFNMEKMMFLLKEDKFIEKFLKLFTGIREVKREMELNDIIYELRNC